MSTWRSILGVIAAAAIVSGCASLDHGTITAKSYESGYWTLDMICAAYDAGTQAGICQMWMPYEHWVPDCWLLDLKSGDEIGRQCVSASAYARYHIGQTYP